MKLHISVGRVSEAIMMLDAIRQYNCTDVESVMQLRIFYGINKAEAINFARQCQYIRIDQNKISFTEDGEHLVHLFGQEYLSPLLQRLVLKNFILYSRPSWSGLIPLGRKEAYLFMSNDERRCFCESGLMGEPNKDIVAWWDDIAAKIRSKQDESKLSMGRQGEEDTLKYEYQRTGQKAIWQSIESNKAGFDIQSIIDSNNPRPLFIEVKSSCEDIEYAEFYISRNEWDIASSTPAVNTHLFYLWLYDTSSRYLAIVSPDELRAHVPTDEGNGTWKETMIPMSIFKERFICIH